MTCKDCLHFHVCEKCGMTVDYPVDDGVCLYFDDKTKFVPVVRCKDCKHWNYKQENFGDCTNRRFHLDGNADPTMEAEDFCSCGERRGK